MDKNSLELAKRPIIDWQSDDFYDEKLLTNELERVFDICHTCRRCVSLCKSFPTLFDLIDNSKTMELDGVAKSDYNKVVAECYLCDLCYMTKCPYVPPHEWNVDFPHLMLRAKAVEFKNKKISYKDKILSNTDMVGKLTSIPVINTIANSSIKNPVTRKILNKILSLHPEAQIPHYHGKTRLSRQFKPITNNNKDFKVAIFATCYGEHNEPQSVLDLISVLDYNEVEVALISAVKCCAMPKFEIGDIEKVISFAKHNKPLLKEYLDKGFKLLAPVPSCVLMFKNELPCLLPNDKDITDIANAFFDPFEYLAYLDKNNKLNKNFTTLNKNILYHAACHQRVQNIGSKTKQILQLIPGVKISVSNRCSGHDGVYGVRKNSYKNSTEIAKPIVDKIDSTIDYVASDCLLAGKHISHLSDKKVIALHPITIVKQAYQI